MVVSSHLGYPNITASNQVQLVTAQLVHLNLDLASLLKNSQTPPKVMLLMSVPKVQHRSVPGLPSDRQPEKYTEKPTIEASFEEKLGERSYWRNMPARLGPLVKYGCNSP